VSNDLIVLILTLNVWLLSIGPLLFVERPILKLASWLFLLGTTAATTLIVTGFLSGRGII
jgi:hypothetical protein